MLLMEACEPEQMEYNGEKCPNVKSFGKGSMPAGVSSPCSEVAPQARILCESASYGASPPRWAAMPFAFIRHLPVHGASPRCIPRSSRHPRSEDTGNSEG